MLPLNYGNAASLTARWSLRSSAVGRLISGPELSRQPSGNTLDTSCAAVRDAVVVVNVDHVERGQLSSFWRVGILVNHQASTDADGERQFAGYFMCERDIQNVSGLHVQWADGENYVSAVERRFVQVEVGDLVGAAGVEINGRAYSFAIE